MNGSDLYKIIKEVAELVNEKGRFVRSRKADGTFDYEAPFPIIHLTPIRTKKDRANGNYTHSCTMFFSKPQNPQTTIIEIDAIMAEMEELSDLFMEALRDHKLLYFPDGDLSTPEVRLYSGIAAGSGLSFTVITKKGC
jgi:hypothetical protein